MKSNHDKVSHRLGLLATVLLCAWVTAFGADTPASNDPLQKLMDGNQRYVANAATHPQQTPERRTQIAKGQAPFAIVLACADSRVSPEVIFDQGLGDLFVIRNAGNVLDDHVIGSIEYAVEHLHTTLIVVLGHSQCGACTAAAAGGHAPGHIASVVESLEPALEEAKQQPGDKVENTVRANARRVAQILSRVEPILSESVKAKKLTVVPARYDLESGKVELLATAAAK